MLAALAFWLMAGTLATHELDAIKRHEWRVLPITSFLPDDVGERVFVWLHVPLFAVVFWVAGEGPDSGAALLLSGFAIGHVGLHWLFRKHPKYEFNNPRSWTLILLPGALGAVHLGLAA